MTVISRSVAGLIAEIEAPPRRRSRPRPFVRAFPDPIVHMRALIVACAHVHIGLSLCA